MVPADFSDDSRKVDRVGHLDREACKVNVLVRRSRQIDGFHEGVHHPAHHHRQRGGDEPLQIRPGLLAALPSCPGTGPRIPDQTSAVARPGRCARSAGRTGTPAARRIPPRQARPHPIPVHAPMPASASMRSSTRRAPTRRIETGATPPGRAWSAVPPAALSGAVVARAPAALEVARDVRTVLGPLPAPSLSSCGGCGAPRLEVPRPADRPLS